MSDLEVRGGGSVVVDPVTLMRAADGFDALATDLDGARMLVATASDQLFSADRSALPVTGQIMELLDRPLREAMAEARAIAADLRAATWLYESADEGARRALTWWSELAVQAGRGPTLVSPLLGAASSLGVALFAHGLDAGRAGRIPGTARLEGPAEPVRLRARPTAQARAPSSLAEMTRRMPTGDERVRVERYTMPDGSRQFAVYISGTRSLATTGGSEPFDMRSNLQLYAGLRSASYDAALEALRRSGAHAGDVVHIAGHSQGAMAGARVALEGPYRTRTLISIGSPVQAEVGAQTLSVALRHTDDPVAALAGGGGDEPVGAPGSFIAERTANPDDALLDLDGHGIAAYAQTAHLLDASVDPRMDAVRELLHELAGAASVEVFSYAAERP
ncbi:hypothetical protein ACFQRL_08750 [Microbacterium fluvii]|uniref:Alpha/beta hydrolase family protein n=1 Tax=Microbacterium fluvii TaxID=415215 RepID=A0ABW2HGB9_9MICO|nr:hypothetical protein [Microbacterium fluvii]MCU4672676.1 hypothetical protein [Microbacterium fluvii]